LLAAASRASPLLSDPSGNMRDMPAPRTIRCRECGRGSVDSRWSPLCPVCYESLDHEQRREHIRPAALDDSPWSDPALLESRLEVALGGELP
jgi:hypothetical protein